MSNKTEFEQAVEILQVELRRLHTRIATLEAECERWRVIAAGCGCVVGCTTNEALQCQTQGMAPEYRVDAMERCIGAARRQMDLLASVELLHADLTRKQRAIDGAHSILDKAGWRSSWHEHARDLLRPEATPTPVDNAVADRATPVGKEQPLSQADELPPIGEHHPSVPQVDWESVARLKESIKEASAIVAGWPEWKQAFCGAPPQPEPMTVKAGFVGLGVDGVRELCQPQLAQPEPSGDRAVRLVKRLSKALHLDAVWHRLSDNTKVELEAILRECDGGAK